MAGFSTTHWSVVLVAGQADADRAHEALEKICQRYWYPLYAYARRFGCDAEAAKDATQGFFAHFIEDNLVAKVDPAAGLFRSFLLTSLKNHLLSQRKHDRALKRGGGCTFFSIDEVLAEARFAIEPSDARSPDKLFERNWAMNLIDQALGLLEQEYRRGGHEALYGSLKPVLIKEAITPRYREIGSSLGIAEGTVKVEVHRLRRRFREILTGLVASTVSGPGEVEQELKYLRKVLS